MNAPVIGYTLDHETAQTYSKLPWYAIRENYLTSAGDIGALPLALPYTLDQLEQTLDLLDGLVIIGGDFDIDPKLYGDDTQHDTVNLKPERTAYEWAICKGALDRHMPILGICGGQQLLAAVLGGSLIQHIPDEIESDIEHEQPNPRDEVGHDVKVMPNSLLHQIVGETTIGVNSAHHQAVRDVPDSVLVSGRAPDGVIEAIELPDSHHPFCLGVQWHPEYHVTEADNRIWEAFAKAAADYRQHKHT